MNDLLTRRLGRYLMFTPLALLSGCDVSLTSFQVPAQAQPGGVVTLTIDVNISGTTGQNGDGGAGCVLQLPNGWVVTAASTNTSWRLDRDEPALLAQYVAEPGHYLVALHSWDYLYGHGGSVTQATVNVGVGVPASASGQYAVKLSLAGSPGIGSWVIQEPAGIAQFSAITAAPYRRTIQVSGSPVSGTFLSDGNGLPAIGLWGSTALGDVDGDGRDDLAGFSRNGTGFWFSRPGTTWVPSTAGLPTSATLINGAQFGHMVAFGHFDRDSFLDLVDGNGRVFFGNGGTSWLGTQPVTGEMHVAVGDVNGDALDDIAFGDRGFTRLRVLLSNGDRTFRDASAGLPALTSPDSAGSVVLADLDGDGDRDLLWAHRDTPNLWLGDGQGNWTPGSGLPDQLNAAAIGDLDGDGLPEILVARANNGLLAFKHATGGTWVPFATNLPSVGNYAGAALFDFDRDGRLDLVAARQIGEGGVEIWRNSAAGFGQVTNTGLPALDGIFQDLTVGDFDGNTFPDFVLAGSHSSGAGVTVWQNRLTGAVPFGAGCGGGAIPTPQLAAIGALQQGNASFAMRLQTGTPGAVVLLWYGGSRAAWPPFALPLELNAMGAPGCKLWVAPNIAFAGHADGNGDYTLGLPVPVNPALAFQTLFAQGSAFAPAANALGMVFTGAMALRIQ